MWRRRGNNRGHVIH
ncbi:MAG: hypothetical protein ABWX92_14400 [Mycetocola sp.]